MAKFVKAPVVEELSPIEYFMNVKEGEADPSLLFTAALIGLLVVAVVCFAVMRRRSS